MNCNIFTRIWLLPFLAIVLITVNSCQKMTITDDDEDVEELEESGMLYVSCSFSQTLTDIDQTRATNVPLYEIATRVTYALMQNGVVVKQEEQINGGGNSFGSISMNLSPGTYQLVIFAHSGTQPVVLSSDGSVTIPGNKPTDCFSYSTQVVVNKGKRTSATCKLTRAVCQLTLLSKDVVPQDVQDVSINTQGISLQYNLFKQIGVGSTSYRVQPDLKDCLTADRHFQFSRFFFLPSIESSLQMQISFGNDGFTMYSRTLEGIKAVVNSHTNITSQLFSTSGADVSSLTANTDWGDDIVIDM